MNSIGIVSVIIPTYERAETLDRVLPAYLRSRLIKELLVVDDGSQDQTAQIVAAHAQRDGRVRSIAHERNLGMTFARNTGILHVSGQLILFTDDDSVPDHGALETLVSHMATTEADIIAGRRIWMRIGESQEEALERASSWRWPLVNRRLLEHYSHAQTDDDVVAPLVNATMLVRREVLSKVRFAECYPGNAWREDSDFQLAAQEAGFKVFFCPHAIFYHYDRPMAGRGRNRLLADLRYLYWIFRNNLTFLKRHHTYLSENMPEALWLHSPWITTVGYVLYRGVLLAQTEVRRAWRSRRYRSDKA